MPRNLKKRLFYVINTNTTLVLRYFDFHSLKNGINMINLYFYTTYTSISALGDTGSENYPEIRVKEIKIPLYTAQ